MSNRSVSAPVFISSLVVVLLLLALLGLKVQSSWVAQPLKKYWNDSGTCYISRYAPDYRVLGGVGRIIEIFSSQYFYRVYSTDGELLKTSEWYLWMREGNPGVAPEFQGEMILYPGAEGWESWTIAQCR
ncbi:hypothetical protein [Pseudomonas sp. H3(2019)]|uniref:hypothetical protein n=1 Tax=Pseudomonas sp. H3(2019) TaxID=2598724 RepID=UPI00119819B8|nr:hypothetical protein [Pseudomonas sp. H3(2019)]TVT86331.1 hypothetical protein FPT12_00110 [Pseudomonas sp. H3(2019)]